MAGGATLDCATAQRMNEQPSKIYLLPNLMTAGNLFCGFTATLKILGRRSIARLQMPILLRIVFTKRSGSFSARLSLIF